MKNLIHAIFHCTECPFSAEDYLSAQRLASDHAKKTGHYVSGETGYSVSYGEKK